jgi:TonB family protein
MSLQHPQLVIENHEEGQMAALLTSADSSVILKDFYYHSPKARGEFREEVRTRMRGARESGCRFTGLVGSAGPSLHLFEASRVEKDPDGLVKEIEKETSLGGRDIAGMAFAAGSGTAYAGSGDLLVVTLPFREMDLLRELGKSMNCSDLRVIPAVLAALSAASRRSLEKGERLCIVGVFSQETRLIIVEKGGVTRLVKVAYGQQGLFETIQNELGLKFVGSAAKLVYDGVYDFSEVAGKVVAPWAEAVKQGLGKDALPSTMLVHLLPPTCPWMGETFAKSLGAPLFAGDSALTPGKEGDLAVDAAQTALVPIWQAACGDEKSGAFALTDWKAAKPLPELISSLPKAAKAAPAPAPAPVATEKPKDPPAAKAAPAAAPKSQATAAKPAAKAKTPPAATKGPPPKAAAKTPAPASAKAPVSAPAEKTEEKKPPFVIIGAVAAVLLLGLILFFVLGRGGDSPEPLALAPAPAPTAPTTPAPAPATPRPTVPTPTPEPAPAPAPRPAPARLSLSTEPSGATVQLDGRSLGRTPLDGLEVEETGNFTLGIALDGFLSESVDVELVSGETASLGSITLVRLAGGVVIESRPSGAIVRRSGERLGRTPLELNDLPPGPYTFALEMDGFVSEEHTVEIRHGEVVQATGFELARQTGQLVVESQPVGIRFRVEDSGDSSVFHEGTTPMTFEAIPVGSYRVLFEREDWPNFTRPARIHHGEVTAVRMEYPEGRLVLNSNPSGAEVRVEDRVLGTTPLELDGLRPGRMAMTLRLAGYLPEPLILEIEPNAEVSETIQLVDLNRVFRPGEVDDLPVAREQARPETNIPIIREESVMARFVVNREGVPENIEIASSTNPRLNNTVMEAVRGWRFEPAKVRGENVRILLGAPFVFQPAQRPDDEEEEE